MDRLMDGVRGGMRGGHWFRDRFDVGKRKVEAERILAKYPDRVPVIVERARYSDAPEIDRKKYLVPADVTVAQLLYVIRKRLKTLAPEQSIFIFTDNNQLPPAHELMSRIYKLHRDPNDLFLYLTYSTENTFGFECNH